MCVGDVLVQQLSPETHPVVHEKRLPIQFRKLDRLPFCQRMVDWEHCAQTFLHEGDGDEVGQRRLVGQYRQVYRAIHQVGLDNPERLELGRHQQRRLPLGDERDKPPERRGRAPADMQGRLLANTLAHGLPQTCDVPCDHACMAEHELARLVQMHPVLGAIEELAFELALQPLDRPRERGLRDVQLRRCRRQCSAIRNRDEMF